MASEERELFCLALLISVIKIRKHDESLSRRLKRPSELPIHWSSLLILGSGVRRMRMMVIFLAIGVVMGLVFLNIFQKIYISDWS